MRTELMQRQINKLERKPVRREMTDAIQENLNNKWDYKLYTDLAYKVCVGKTAKQLREERNAPQNAVASDYMTADEIAAVTKTEYRIGVLIEIGMDYHQIKALLLNKMILTKIA